ncbi:MAG: DUF177 domain-containing protein [Acidobacteriota bacterium]|nr:DUF177 domain-containing protein [Acidobacteriota bacterium]
MELEVDNLSAAPDSFTHTFTSEELSLDQTEELRLLPGASIAGTASRKGDEVRLRGKISARVESLCDRCARTVLVPLEIEFDAPYVPATESASIENVELNQPDLDFSVYEGDTIAINDLVREQILLALPSRLLCREDCKGLCPTCGVDLNKEACACGDTEVDPRWAALAALKKK